MDSKYAQTVQKNVQLRSKPFIAGSSKKFSKMNIGDSLPKNQCKICLMDEHEQQKLMSPCKCTGSLQYVHKQCFIEFFMVKYQKFQINLQSKLKEQFKCEICHQQYNYFFQSINQCGNLQYFKKQIKSKKFLAIIILLILIFSLGTLIWMIINIIVKTKLQISKTKNQLLIIYISTGISVLFLFIGVFGLIKYFIIQKKMTVVIRDRLKNQIKLMTMNNPNENLRLNNFQLSQLIMHNL